MFRLPQPMHLCQATVQPNPWVHFCLRRGFQEREKERKREKRERERERERREGRERIEDSGYLEVHGAYSPSITVLITIFGHLRGLSVDCKYSYNWLL